MKIAGLSSVSLSRSANATTSTNYVYGSSSSGAETQNASGHGCVLSLDSSAVDSFWDSGNAQVSVGCDIIVDSANSSALDVSGSAQLNLNGTNGAQPLVFIRGSYTATTPSRVQPATGPCLSTPLCIGANRVSDPYSSIGIPSQPSDGVELTNYSTSTNATLKPGIYHNGIAINSKASVTLSPGTYIIDGGTFQVNGQAQVIGDKINIVFTKTNASSYAQATINGGAVVAMRAPSKDDCNKQDGGLYGPCLPGILFYGDRNMPTGTNFKLNGGSSQALVGALYLPSAALNFTGGANTTAVLPSGTLPSGNYDGCMQIIADTIKFTGNSNFGGAAYSGCTDGKFMTAFEIVAMQSPRIIQ